MNWQSIIAYILVAIAAWWIGRRVYRTFKRIAAGAPSGGDCGSCGNNPANPSGPSVISLDQVKSASRQDHSSGPNQ